MEGEYVTFYRSYAPSNITGTFKAGYYSSNGIVNRGTYGVSNVTGTFQPGYYTSNGIPNQGALTAEKLTADAFPTGYYSSNSVHCYKESDIIVSAGETINLEDGYYSGATITAEASALKAKSVSSVKSGTFSYSISSGKNEGNQDTKTTTKTATYSLSALGISESDIILVAGVANKTYYSTNGDSGSGTASGSFTYTVDGDTLTITAQLTASDTVWSRGTDWEVHRGAKVTLKYDIYKVVVS